MGMGALVPILQTPEYLAAFVAAAMAALAEPDADLDEERRIIAEAQGAGL